MIKNDLRKDLKQFSGLGFPISGGRGHNISNPIIIEANEYAVGIEYEIIGLIQQMRGKSWKTVGQQLIRKEDGRSIDKISIIVDNEHRCRSYYFDITKSFGKYN
mgnify:CR=1 FL=1